MTQNAEISITRLIASANLSPAKVYFSLQIFTLTSYFIDYDFAFEFLYISNSTG